MYRGVPNANKQGDSYTDNLDELHKLHSCTGNDNRIFFQTLIVKVGFHFRNLIFKSEKYDV